MMKSIWMNAWDVKGQSPESVVDRLKGCGLNTCSLGFSYHGGRMVLPMNPEHLVYEQARSALYYPARSSTFESLRLQPRTAPEADLVPPFVEACRKSDVEVNAWTVVCHNDELGEQHPDCCVRNAFGDRYTYALCPSNPQVRDYARALCRDIAETTPQLSRLELEALSFMGYSHDSLHDKRGVSLPGWVEWLLSVCLCPHCRNQFEGDADELEERIRSAVRDYLQAAPADQPSRELREALEHVLGADRLDALLRMRRQTIRTLLDDIREVTGSLHVNLRLALSPLFTGGKSALDWSDVAGRADSATISFFGVDRSEMRQKLDDLPDPDERPVSVYGGFIFHGPDCTSRTDVEARMQLLADADLDGVSAYCLSMATNQHLDWLTTSLQ